jgi:hypothetical protein
LGNARIPKGPLSQRTTGGWPIRLPLYAKNPPVVLWEKKPEKYARPASGFVGRTKDHRRVLLGVQRTTGGYFSPKNGIFSRFFRARIFQNTRGAPFFRLFRIFGH